MTDSLSCQLPVAGGQYPTGDWQRTTGNGSLARLVQDFADVPPLPLGERAGLLDDHAIADVDVRLLAVSEELARPLDVLLVHPVFDEILHGDHDGLLQ